MLLMLVTAIVFQELMSWLKLPAFQNIAIMSLTFPVSQGPRLRLKLLHSQNMLFIFITWAVFHSSMFPLKA